MRFSERVGRLATITAQAEDAAMGSYEVQAMPGFAPGHGRFLPFPGGVVIQVSVGTDDATIIHEFLHVIHPDWTEGRVEARCLEIMAAV